ncbi:unnamed protein product [Clavelina lepadiformis]|uniref:Uncharacterized protein n=1 Tax=Clavelina lepadiformis TaxID=159417 RepID=A0ABP0GMZ2_CLALP
MGCRSLKEFVLWVTCFFLIGLIFWNQDSDCKSDNKRSLVASKSGRISPNYEGKPDTKSTFDAHNPKLSLGEGEAPNVRTESVSFKKSEVNSLIDFSKKTPNEWLDCDDIKQIVSNLDEKAEVRKENAEGNKGIYLTSIRSKRGDSLKVVLKMATVKNISCESELYRYTSALRELANLRKLRHRGWKGIPELYGACVRARGITYVVSHVPGRPFCQGSGVDQGCAMAHDVKSYLTGRENPELLVMTWITKVTCFFKQFEEDQVFMEDIAGTNLFLVPDSLDIYVVDADSILFYGDVPFLSRSSCRLDEDCSRPSGNLWRSSALNHKIYYTCKEIMGYCQNNTCRGYDASLHTCGVGRWLIAPFRNIIPDRYYNEFKKIMHCTMEEDPVNRCRMADACERSDKMLQDYLKYK